MNKIDEKDLRLVRPEEIPSLQGVIYRKDGDKFSTVIIREEEKKRFPIFLRTMAEILVREKRLFTRLNKPFCSFQ